MKTPSRTDLENMSLEQLNDFAVELAQEDEEIKKVRHYFIDEFWARLPQGTLAPGDLGEGELRPAAVEGRQILWAKVGGTVFALANKCPHRGFPLHHNGKLDGYTITCAYHGGQFDIRTGACVKHPTETFPCERFVARTGADGMIDCEPIRKGD